MRAIDSYDRILNGLKAAIYVWLVIILQASAQVANYVYDSQGNLTEVIRTNVVGLNIATQPQSALFYSNNSISFSVIATGVGISYQWLSNGVPIFDATNDTFYFSNPIGTNGSFSVIISNSSGSITSTPAAIWADSNGNGIPDWWEMQYFGNLNQPADGDYDVDGVSNIDEYREGTNPADSKSFNPRLQIQASFGTVVVSPDLPYYTMGQVVSLAAIPDLGQMFLGWGGSATATNSTITVTMNSNSKVTASFGLPLPMALDNTNLTWTTGGSAPWFGQTQVSEDGLGAAQSGIIYGGQQSWLQAVTPNLPQSYQLIFWWKISSQAPDGLSFSIDGTAEFSIRGIAADWQQISVTLPAGIHRLVWAYVKQSNDNPTGLPFADSAWVDEVTLSPITFLDLNVRSSTNLHGFAPPSNNPAFGILTNSEGFSPQAGLVLSGTTLYGTASQGGRGGNGTVFRINSDGTGFTNIYSFTSGPGSFPTVVNTDGIRPVAGLTLSGATLFGTAEFGGSFGNGTVFALNTNGSGFTNLHSFTQRFGLASTNRDGAYSVGKLILLGNTLYGTASQGGSAGGGSVFAVNTDGTAFTNLHNFSGGGDGANPVAGLISSGNTLYGTTYEGGSSDTGALYALATDGTDFTTLYSFSAGDYDSALGAYTNSDGAGPQDDLILSGNTLYGTTSQSGAVGDGTVFAVNTDGTGFTNLHSFTNGSDGSYPLAGLTLWGNVLYGTVASGGGSNYGTVFRVNIDGTAFTTLHSFTGYSGDGAYPMADLILSGNTLYGTAESGGGSDYGTVFNLSLMPINSPQLTIILSGANVVLMWPTNAAGFILESATNLSATAWSTNLSSPFVINGQYVITNPISGTERFYRLSQ